MHYPQLLRPRRHRTNDKWCERHHFCLHSWVGPNFDTKQDKLCPDSCCVRSLYRDVSSRQWPVTQNHFKNKTYLHVAQQSTTVNNKSPWKCHELFATLSENHINGVCESIKAENERNSEDVINTIISILLPLDSNILMRNTWFGSWRCLNRAIVVITQLHFTSWCKCWLPIGTLHSLEWCYMVPQWALLPYLIHRGWPLGPDEAHNIHPFLYPSIPAGN